MTSLTLTMGRNWGRAAGEEAAGRPMSDGAWELALVGMRGALRDAQTDDSWLEEHTGTGVWEGQEEESRKVTLHNADMSAIDKVRHGVACLAEAFAQDAVALTVGESELVRPVYG